MSAIDRLLCLLLILVSLVQHTLTQYHNRSVQEECPDRLLIPYEYESVAKYMMTTRRDNAYPCTIITQCSADRLTNLENQARLWGGAISVAVYIPTTSILAKSAAMNKVHDLVRKLEDDKSYTGWLTISLLFGHEETPWRWSCNVDGAVGAPLYPINALRNLAIAASGSLPHTSAVQTPLLFLLDVDFMPSPGLNAWIAAESRNATFLDTFKAGSMMVVPAFETESLAPKKPSSQSFLSGVWGGGQDSPAVPRPSLSGILSGLRDGSVQVFHGKRFAPGHRPTNTPLWQELSSIPPGQRARNDVFPHTYKIKFQEGYEPYIVLAREHLLPYDERFRGYGQNKHVQLKWLQRRHPDFHVLLDHFVVAQEHRATQISKQLGPKSAFSVNMMHAYRQAMVDMDAGLMPLVSDNTARLLSANGWSKIYATLS